MADLALDLVEEILVRLDVKDLIRCKRVCKSWQSFISTPRFVKAHLKHSYNNDLNNHELGHRRVGMGISMGEDDWGFYSTGRAVDEIDWLGFDRLLVVGSCNGLVCVSPNEDAKFVVTNPSTRERKQLPTPPYPRQTGEGGCWGFGYDSSIDDYKVIGGFGKKKRTSFYVLTLKSNTWKFIGQVKYEYAGILCGGALHWFMFNDDEDKQVLMSLDLSTEEFKEIPIPAAKEILSDFYKLGVIEECLCIFLDRSRISSKIWVMKNNKWEIYNDRCENKYDVAHTVMDSLWSIYRVNDGERVPRVGSYISASIFVKSLVSPHPHECTYEGEKRNAKQQGKEEGNIRKRKRNMKRKRSCKHKKPLVWI